MCYFEFAVGVSFLEKALDKPEKLLKNDSWIPVNIIYPRLGNAGSRKKKTTR